MVQVFLGESVQLLPMTARQHICSLLYVARMYNSLAPDIYIRHNPWCHNSTPNTISTASIGFKCRSCSAPGVSNSGTTRMPRARA